ncbi:MAG: Dyp-type peroxidase [Comamonas sp.]
MPLNQAGILQALPVVSRYMFWDLRGDAAAARAALAQLQAWADGDKAVVCVGEPLAQLLGVQIAGLKSFPEIKGPSGPLPLTPHALCLWLRGGEQGDVLQSARTAAAFLKPAFACVKVVDCFRHGLHDEGAVRDLTGYEDGTENPKDEAATHAAIADGMGAGLDGGSYFAVQQWLHDMAAFERMSALQKDHMIGRRLSDNEELDDAPESAHVKRTAQESFEPEAFILRRNMPWWQVQADGSDTVGAIFAGFGRSFYAFEAQMRRMAGEDDGIADGLFRMSQPITNSYYWCPPMQGGKLDLRALGL